MEETARDLAPAAAEPTPGPEELAALRITVSGTYGQRVKYPGSHPRLARGELRLDVDGLYPQMVVSVTLAGALKPVHFVADLGTKDGVNYTGKIWYASGAHLLGKSLTLTVTRAPGLKPKHLVTVSVDGSAPVLFDYLRPSFHPLTLEYDYASDARAYASFDTGSHPNRPADLPVEALTIEKVYRRAGFDVKVSSGGGVVPISEAIDGAWSYGEMHDAMEAHFSRYATAPRWAAWIFFASLSDLGEKLGGIMFDSEEAPTRQGCAVFVDSFIADEPVGDPDAAAFVQRMRFWCACHEMGHCLNLAHSWQKDYPYGNSWVPLTNDSESRSLMNYPFLVNGGSTAYFADHEYRFDDPELVFLRHAPYQFVQPGNAEWFIDHGVEEARSPDAPLELSVRANRDTPVYDFLECVVLELKLKNVSPGPIVVDENVLAGGGVSTIIQKRSGSFRQHLPYARPIFRPAPKVLEPGASLYQSLFVSAGVNGFDLSEPGDYVIRCSVDVGGARAVSGPLRLRIRPPGSHEEERIAQDFFSRDVGRVLAFDGSRVLRGGVDVLQEVVQVLPDRRVARHAQVALGANLARDTKVLRVLPDGARRVEVVKAALEESRAHLANALLGDTREISTTLSHVDYGDYMLLLLDILQRLGNAPAVIEAANQARECLDRIGAPAQVKARFHR